MKKLAILLFLLAIAVTIKGCGDYYVNVDKEAIKMEVDSLIGGFGSEEKK